DPHLAQQPLAHGPSRRVRRKLPWTRAHRRVALLTAGAPDDAGRAASTLDRTLRPGARWWRVTGSRDAPAQAPRDLHPAVSGPRIMGRGLVEAALRISRAAPRSGDRRPVDGVRRHGLLSERPTHARGPAATRDDPHTRG